MSIDQGLTAAKHLKVSPKLISRANFEGKHIQNDTPVYQDEESWVEKMDNYKSGEMGLLEDISISFHPNNHLMTLHKNQSTEISGINFKDFPT